jgi:hypothetical protein
LDLRRPTGAEAELVLLAAVLVRAARDLVMYSRGNTAQERKIAADALQWIFGPSPDDRSITSFRGICQALDLDCDSVRDRIFEMLPPEAQSLQQDTFGHIRPRPA